MYKHEFNADALVSIRVNDLVEDYEISYRKKSRHFFGTVKEGYYFTHILGSDGPYTKEEIESKFSLIFKDGKFYEKASVVFSFAGGVKKTKLFDSIEEALKCASEVREISSGTWISL